MDGDDEGFELLADIEGRESAEADVAYVKEQRRLRGEPSMSRKEALLRANSFLRAEQSNAEPDPERMFPNGLQDLWVVDTVDPSRSDEDRIGDGPLAVMADGAVRQLGSAPDQFELIGVEFPDD